LLERVAGNRIDRPVGSVVYTQLLEKDGGIAADVTITRLAVDHFRLITGAGYVNSDMGWLRIQIRDEEVGLRESSDELAVIGLWGPMATKVLPDLDMPFMQGRDARIGGFPVFAQRVTYVGEMGWELYLDAPLAGQVWDRLMDAGRDFGITPGGYRVLDSLRMEKGYRYYGADMGLLDNPFEAGLGFAVAKDKWPNIDRNVTRRLRTLAVGGEEYVPIYGGEAVLHHGRVVGRLRSCAYGFTARKNLAYSYLPIAVGVDARVEVEVFGQHVPALVMRDRVLEPQPTR
jgi:4-methylaminobutanoate oxidase (formaldehyde-forming)